MAAFEVTTEAMVSDSSKTICKPGERVQKPGIYQVIHDGHRQAHEASFRLNETFPRCNSCKGRVRFQLVKEAQGVDEHEKAAGEP
jgi:hypothetical protein